MTNDRRPLCVASVRRRTVPAIATCGAVLLAVACGPAQTVPIDRGGIDEGDSASEVRPGDDHGDTQGTATRIRLASSIAGSLEAEGDVDVFRLEVASPGGVLTVSTTGDTDTVGTLYLPDGTNLTNDDAASDPDFHEQNFRIVTALVAGSHFVAVEGWCGDIGGGHACETGPYELHVNWSGSTGLDLPSNPDAVFFELWSHGNSPTPIEYPLGKPPRLALTVGGELFSFQDHTRDGTFEGYHLPEIGFTHLGPTRYESVLEAMARTVLPSVGSISIREHDLPLFRYRVDEFILHDRSGTHSIRVNGWRSPYTSTEPRLAALGRLVELLDRSVMEADGGRPWRTERIQVWVRRHYSSDVTEEPWPLDAAPDLDRRSRRCLAFDGPEAERLLAIFRESAGSRVGWNHDGILYALNARPLIRGEPACRR